MKAATRHSLLEYLLPGATLTALVAVDVALRSNIVISGSFAIAAAIAAVTSSVATTMVVAVAATTLAGLSGLWNDNFGSQQWAIRLGLAAVLSLVAVVSAVIRVRRERSLNRMTVIAETAQRALLRPMPAEVGNVQLAARYLSATDDTLVGGDLYEAVESPYGVRVIVGDVKGKGIDAVQLAATILNTFRQVAPVAPSTGCVAAELNEVADRAVGDEDFVTAIIAEFHDDHTVTLVNCGHPLPLLVNESAQLTEVDTGPPQLPLGLGSSSRATTLSMPVTSRLLFYTDGLLETRDPEKQYFPLQDQGDALASPSYGDALDRLLARLHRHAAGHITDDVAMVLAGYRVPER